MKRTDPHRPSALIADDYREVAFLPNPHGMRGIDGLVECDPRFIIEERKRLDADMKRTGGRWSQHEHGGACDICGNWLAMSFVVFHHAPTNTYIRAGETCAEKLHFSQGQSFSMFKRQVIEWELARAGKAKARGLLDEWGLSRAWDIYNAERDETTGYEEFTIVDVVNKLIRYGSLSERQREFITTLIDRIDRRAEAKATRQAEWNAAEEAPVTEARIAIEGDVVMVKETDTPFGYQTKIIVRTLTGWKAYGTCPSAINTEGLRGSRVRFTAAFTRSDDDPKFGFFSRPTKAEIIEHMWRTQA